LLEAVVQQLALVCFSALARPGLWSQLAFETTIRALSLNLAVVTQHFTRKRLLAIFRAEDA